MSFPTPAAQPAPQPGMSIGGAVQLQGRGVQTGFFQRNQPAFWLFVVFLAFTALTVLTEQLTYLQVVPTGWIMSLVLLALFVAPVAIAIYYLDLFEHEPVSLLVAAFMWGGVVSIGFAGATNTALIQVLAKIAGPDVAGRWGAALVAPPVEETLKYAGVVVIYLIARREFDDLIDGFVYGALVGLGFAAVENIQYFIGSISTLQDQIGPVLFMFTLRVLIVGAYMHALWTGISGVGLAYFVTQRDQPRQKRLLVAGGLFALAIVAHTVWNSPLLAELTAGGNLFGAIIFGLIKGSGFFAFLAIVVLLAQRREFRWFQGVMAADTGGDVITNEEVADLGNLRSRWRARRVMAARKGPAGAKLHKRMQSEQLKLALMLSRTGDPNGADVLAKRDAIRALRIQLQGLPDVAVATPATYSAALAAPAVAPSYATAGFQPTHQVPAAGLAAWAEPDPSKPAIATLAPGTQLQVVEQNGAWSRVLGSNGWTGWVDGRLLVPLR